MANARALRNPPIQEAVIQFQFEGVNLDKKLLASLAEPYVAKGWVQEEIHNFETALNHKSDGVELLSSGAIFIGLVVRDPEGRHLVQLRTDSLAVSNARHYESWEALEDRARIAFEEFVAVASPPAVSRLSARFINRIPSFGELQDFDQILERPPLTVEGFPGATVADFLRRHVITGLDGGFTANLTIGTVTKEPGEDSAGKALVIDTDVFKSLQAEPAFETLRPELGTLRSIKNRLFFGSLKEELVEKFQ